MLQLAIHHGCSHEQIATATGMPLGTVKTHARRGLIRIRQILAEQGVLSPEDLARATAPASDAKQRGSAAALAPFDLKNQLSSNRTQGVPNMIALVREHAARIAGG